VTNPLDNLSQDNLDKYLLRLEDHLKSPLHKLWRDELEHQILETTNLVTSIVPDSIQSFFAREQMIGSLGEKLKQFDSFGFLKQSLEEQKQILANKQDNEN